MMEHYLKPPQHLVKAAYGRGLPKDAHVTFHLQMRKCGNLRCKCAYGEMHGPFWYAYYRNGNRLKSMYIGKPDKPKKG